MPPLVVGIAQIQTYTKGKPKIILPSFWRLDKLERTVKSRPALSSPRDRWNPTVKLEEDWRVK